MSRCGTFRISKPVKSIPLHSTDDLWVSFHTTEESIAASAQETAYSIGGVTMIHNEHGRCSGADKTTPLLLYSHRFNIARSQPVITFERGSSIFGASSNWIFSAPFAKPRIALFFIVGSVQATSFVRTCFAVGTEILAGLRERWKRQFSMAIGSLFGVHQLSIAFKRITAQPSHADVLLELANK